MSFALEDSIPCRRTGGRSLHTHMGWHVSMFPYINPSSLLPYPRCSLPAFMFSLPIAFSSAFGAAALRRALDCGY